MHAKMSLQANIKPIRILAVCEAAGLQRVPTMIRKIDRVSSPLPILLLALVGGLCLGSTPARADSVVSVGLASSVPSFNFPYCCQDINAKFLWNSTTDAIASAVSVTASGPLGAFNFLDEFTTGADFFHFQFKDHSGDVFTYSPLPPGFFPAPGDYPLQLAVSCATSTDVCSKDGFEGFYEAQGNASVVSVPEGSAFVWLLLGEFFFFALFYLTGWRFARSPDGRFCLRREGKSSFYKILAILARQSGLLTSRTIKDCSRGPQHLLQNDRKSV